LVTVRRSSVKIKGDSHQLDEEGFKSSTANSDQRKRGTNEAVFMSLS